MTQSILITGCSSGIGLCAAKMLKEHGFQVFASARTSQDVEKLQAQGLNALVLDLDDSASITSAVTEVLEQTGGTLDALINNAAYGQPGAIEDLNREQLRAQFETNVFGTQELTNQVLKVMRKQGSGRIIHIGSMLGVVAFAYRGAYSASKYALEGLADAQRVELKGSNIFLSLIQPGPITSQFRVSALNKFHQVDIAGSAHEQSFTEMLAKGFLPDEKRPFNRPPEAVVKKMLKCLNAKKPKPRYRVTFPCHMFALLKRILPSIIIDKMMHGIAEHERKTAFN